MRFIATALICLSFCQARADLLFDDGFESGNFNAYGQELCCSHSAVIVDDKVRSGDYAVKLEIRQDDPFVSNANRAELLPKINGSTSKTAGSIGSERWFAFSVYCPTGGMGADPAAELFWQVHGVPDFDCQTWRSPPLAFYDEDGTITITKRWETDRCGSDADIEDMTSYAMALDTWVDYVIHVKWSYGSDGFVEIWKNGVKVVDDSGPNYFNDDTPGYLKVGIYKWSWKYDDYGGSVYDTRWLYYDNIRIGDGNSSYEEMTSDFPGESEVVDETPPVLESVAADDSSTVRLTFNELMDETSCGQTGNYSITPGITVTAARLESDGVTVTLTTAPLTKDQSYTLTVSGVKDRADTPNTITTVQKTLIWTGCLSSSASWQSFNITEQTGSFEATYDATPQAALCNGLVTFSNGDAEAYTDCAMLVRFNRQEQKIDVRNGDDYQADQDVSYESGTQYHFRVTADIAAHTYSVYVTPEGGSETPLATDYAFRTEQNGVTALDTWSIFDDLGSFQVCGMEVDPVTSGIRSRPGTGLLNNNGRLPGNGRMISINGNASVGGPSVGPGVYIVETVNGNTREYRKTLVIE